MSKWKFFARRKELPLPTATSLLAGTIVPRVTINHPWWGRQEHLLETLVKEGRLTAEQASSPSRQFIEQPDGSLFCAYALPSAPELLAGTTVPAGAWQRG